MCQRTGIFEQDNLQHITLMKRTLNYGIKYSSGKSDHDENNVNGKTSTVIWNEKRSLLKENEINKEKR